MTEGIRIRYKRKLLGMTAEDLAKACLVSKQTICNVENEKEHGSKESTIKLINYVLAEKFIEWDPEDYIKRIYEDLTSQED